MGSQYFNDRSLFVAKWNSSTENMTNNEFLMLGKEFAKFVSKYKPTRYLNLMNEFKFAITPEIQKKIATVLPKELFPQVSVEQLVEEEMSLKLKSVIFNDEEEAIAWLMKN